MKARKAVDLPTPTSPVTRAGNCSLREKERRAWSSWKERLWKRWSLSMAREKGVN